MQEASLLSNIVKVAYVHGRPNSHLIQQKCAHSINADFIPVDFKIRWHDKPEANKFRKYVSWIVCAFTFPNKKKYDYFLAGGLHTTLPLMRFFGLLRKNQKIIVHLGDHSLYFLYSNKYPSHVKKLLLWSLKRYDAIICEGQMGVFIAKELLKKKLPPIYCVPAGIPIEHFAKIKNVFPNINSKKILFMGSGPNENRLYYKGLDLIIAAFNLAFKDDSSLELVIVGDWEDNIKIRLLNECSSDAKNSISFVAETKDLGSCIKDAGLYLHCGRGEAYGVTVLIAMLGGLIPIVSEWTGSKEVVEKLDSNLIVQLDKNRIAEKIHYFFSLPTEKKIILSQEAKKIAMEYEEDKVVDFYKKTFIQLTNDFSIKGSK
jgi:glycosyltransferase involved in cell wall biosynthesis